MLMAGLKPTRQKGNKLHKLQHKSKQVLFVFSILLLSFSRSVTPQVVSGHTELQEIFDLSLLPGGRLLPAPGGSPPSSLLLLPVLLTACLTASLLMLLLSLG